MNKTITERGFKVITFYDKGNRSCSLQESSAATPSIWLGIDKVVPKLFLPDIDPTKTGWIDFPIPEQVKIFSMMELTQDMVKDLLPYLNYFAENGSLPSFGNKEEKNGDS